MQIKGNNFDPSNNRVNKSCWRDQAKGIKSFKAGLKDENKNYIKIMFNIILMEFLYFL